MSTCLGEEAAWEFVENPEVDVLVHYASSPVANAMAEHGYHLQYLLYAVALDRYLQLRIPGYRYDEIFPSIDGLLKPLPSKKAPPAAAHTGTAK